MSFRENLRNELNFQGMQTKELAERTGINKRTLDGYLAKKGNEPTVGNACKIAKALGVTVEWLTEGIESENTSPFSGMQQDLRHFSEDDIQTVRAVIKAISGKYTR
ncbi:MAG: helix-turn-helix transcriptional regulator [Treponema sp.]|nr:helix-turn-helix transcriptional regulator [Treponema sp.]